MFNINFTTQFFCDEKIIKKISEIVNTLIEKKQNWTLNLIFISNEEIKLLNKNYRSIDKETDVLSFHYFDDFSDLKNDDIAWEIVFSLEKIKQQWILYWLWETKEFYKLLIHSILHILWYDHELDDEYKIMQDLENKIWFEIFEKNQ